MSHYPNLYDKHFKEALNTAFPGGVNVARTFMKRLIDPRNRLAHANPISLRQAEQVICYTGDIIDSLKEYYNGRNMSEEYNVPLILKVIDSYGNTYHRDQFSKQGTTLIKNLSKDARFDLRPGDILTLEVEVDPTFSEEEYEIRWASATGFSNEVKNGRKAIVNITEKQVGMEFGVQCKVVSNKNWHRISSMKADDFLIYYVKVLPPKM